MSGWQNMDVAEQIRAIWQDQAEFNRELRPAPASMTEDERCQLTSDLALHMHSEISQLLDNVKWKKNRRSRSTVNLPMAREELIDIFKLWVSMAQVWEPDLAKIMEAYWEKSMVVRRRHAEEFIRDSQRPSAVIDLDNVLADFGNGARAWMLAHGYPATANGNLQFTRDEWRLCNTRFYASGGFRTLPLMPHAREFVEWCRAQGWNVVFLTSRGIDRYPNILTDTLWWMDHHCLHADFVWWGSDKPAKLEQEEVLRHVQLVVDDDEGFIRQYADVGVKKVFWLDPSKTDHRAFDERHPYRGVCAVSSLQFIMENFNGIQ